MSFFSKVGSFFKNAASKVSTAVKSVGSKVSTAVKSIGSKVSSAVKNIVPAVAGAVGGAVDGYLDGGIRGAIRGAVGGVTDAFKNVENEEENIVASSSSSVAPAGQVALTGGSVPDGSGVKTSSKMDRVISALKQKGYNGYTALLSLKSSMMGV